MSRQEGDVRRGRTGEGNTGKVQPQEARKMDEARILYKETSPSHTMIPATCTVYMHVTASCIHVHVHVCDCSPRRHVWQTFLI